MQKVRELNTNDFAPWLQFCRWHFSQCEEDN